MPSPPPVTSRPRRVTGGLGAVAAWPRRLLGPGGIVEWVAGELTGLVAPPACVACREPVRGGHERLCGGCRAALPWLRGARCPRCGLPLPCAPCPAARAAFRAAWAPVAHAGSARALVAALKFRGALAVADVMAAQIAAGLAGAGLAPPADEPLAGMVLVPVPAHPARRRARGFDPAERLARALARRTGRPKRAALRRRGPPARQLGAPRAVRRQPGRLEIAARGRPPPRVALIDDVHTTGATLDACARALRAAGTEEVIALTYARALRRGGGRAG
jgi:predicted amidophosphoribosyltransferase